MRLVVACAITVLAPVVAGAQQPPSGRPPAAPPVRSVEGRVVRPLGAREAPVAGEWVTLHRVAQDSAAPLDSVRTDAGGRYAFRYRPFGSADAIYFVSARYGGIAYFAPPLTSSAVSGDAADIAVFDTSSAAPPTVVRGRHLIVSAEDSAGRRSVIEVFEISNDSTLTYIAASGAGPGTFSAALPPGVRDFRAGQGDVPPEAIEVRGDRAIVVAPFAPGLKQLSYSYTLDADDFPLVIPVERPTSVFEVLVEDASATASGARLTPVDPVTVDGRNFRRFLAQDARARDTVRIAIADAGMRTSQYVPGLLLALGSALVVGLGLALRRRRDPVAAAQGEPRDATGAARERLTRAISELDAAFASEREPSAESRAAYVARRAELKRELTQLLATPSGPR
jgi:hypothetical protein